MSRWATQRSDIKLEARRPPRRRRMPPRHRLRRGPDRPDAAESERAGGVLVEVPFATAYVRTAVIDDGGNRPAAVPERDSRAAWEGLVGDAEVGVKATRGAAAVVVPGRQALPEHRDPPGASG